MPIYLYQCDTCGVRFECQQRITEAPLEECPECDGHVRRIIQPVGVIFKGSGFYVTDNRQGSSATLKPAKDKDKKDSTAAEPAKDTPSASSTESKSD